MRKRPGELTFNGEPLLLKIHTQGGGRAGGEGGQRRESERKGGAKERWVGEEGEEIRERGGGGKR